MAAETQRMNGALQAQHAEMTGLLERANRFEAQSRSAQDELARVREQMRERAAAAAELELLSVPAAPARIDAPAARRRDHAVRTL